MFDALAEKVQSAIEKIGRKGRIDEETLEKGLREIKLALLEADVNYRVVSNFIKDIKEKALGAKVIKGVNPAQQLVKIVHDELVQTLGGEAEKLNLKGKPSVILLIGLQGSGKTTTAAKLANYLKKQGKRVLLTSVDVYRPAAMLQLKKLGDQIGIPVFLEEKEKDAVKIAKDALLKAKDESYDVLVVDTAGRLHIDEELLEEARKIKEEVVPDETLFVIDSMTGQESVNIAKAFDERVGMTGIVLTKMDSDARGGVALSVKGVTGKPIKFAGVGEKIDDFEPFYPDRVASRILGMGDIVSLVEKAQEVIDEKEALSMQEKLLSGEFTLEDFRQQLRMIQRLGPLQQIIRMIPGLSSQKMLKQLEKAIDDKKLKRIEAIINSMTPEERRNHAIINASRKRRIAKGSGTSVKEVDALIKQFVQAKMAMKQMKKMQRKMAKKGGRFPFPFM
ncbi:signal recognition particle protein [Desulfurobacterium thermolithotrophum DSM 11699]|uniref:Signal recognition particle protein n=1 Tax=Desulfurobacterium thermolithotrophum (strain DSM 11699 / BSA) TaxID=868864 RepID=F0S0Y6_DESTD|nr:signal recognition particle protein [Desulfurobacterium thermolithotrophum]ADY72790.1 signal recognition particle protein [Desulfurobacterium thermolithotrophum DSM 11699]